MVKGVFEAFHIRTAEDVRRSAHMIMALCTQEIYEEKTIEAAVLAGDAPASVGSGDDTAFVAVDQHGSRLLQALLCYKGQEIVPLTTSVLTIPTPALKKLAIDPVSTLLCHFTALSPFCPLCFCSLLFRFVCVLDRLCGCVYANLALP
jgi:hypothetical protein